MIRRLVILSAAVLASGVFAASCGGGTERGPLTELQRVRAGDVEVVLLSSDRVVRQGKDSFVLEFRSSASGQLVDVGEVRVDATMPMVGMAPMVGTSDVRPADVAGRYSIASDLSMTGDWRIAVEWNGPAGRGAVTLPMSVQ